MLKKKKISIPVNLLLCKPERDSGHLLYKRYVYKIVIVYRIA